MLYILFKSFIYILYVYEVHFINVDSITNINIYIYYFIYLKVIFINSAFQYVFYTKI